MNCMNNHNHLLEIYIWKNKVWNKIYELPPNKFTIKINKNSNDLYGIGCRKCNEIYNDYKSDFSFQGENFFLSLFCNKSSIDNFKFNDVTCFTFNEFDDYILLGTKNEIISFIRKEFNSLEINRDELRREIDSTNAQNKK